MQRFDRDAAPAPDDRGLLAGLVGDGTPLLSFVGLALGAPWPVIVFGAAAAVAVILLRKGNIARLRAGTESRFRLRRA